MKSNTTKELIIVFVILAIGFFAGFFTNVYFFQPSKPTSVDEERKRIEAMPDSAFVNEFNSEFGSKQGKRK